MFSVPGRTLVYRIVFQWLFVPLYVNGENRMKGVVFTEFVEMVEETFSPELLDEVFDCVELASGGAYTSVGTYDHNELLQLVGELSRQTNVAVPELVNSFGHYLLKRFVEGFPQFFDGVNNAFEFLESVDNHIHVEVRKLYADAELPRFKVRRVKDDELEMVYISERPFADLAQGLIEATAVHFGNEICLERIGPDEANRIRFHLMWIREGAKCTI